MAKVPALVCLVLVTALLGRLLRFRPTGLGVTLCFRPSLIIWTLYVRLGSLYVKS